MGSKGERDDRKERRKKKNRGKSTNQENTFNVLKKFAVVHAGVQGTFIVFHREAEVGSVKVCVAFTHGCEEKKRIGEIAEKRKLVVVLWNFFHGCFVLLKGEQRKTKSKRHLRLMSVQCVHLARIVTTLSDVTSYFHRREQRRKLEATTFSNAQGEQQSNSIVRCTLQTLKTTL